MKTDEFENQLRRQPLRAVPAEWRAEILGEANKAATIDVTNDAHAQREGRRPILSASLPWWREWLWPSPRAWAGLAAAWLVIGALHVTTMHRSSEMARQTPLPSPETESSLAAQRRELARLLDNFNEATPPYKPAPSGPRSESASPPRV